MWGEDAADWKLQQRAVHQRCWHKYWWSYLFTLKSDNSVKTLLHKDKLTCLCSGCMNGMVLVTQADCQTGKVDLCPPTCSHLSFPSNCTVACVVGKTHDGVCSLKNFKKAIQLCKQHKIKKKNTIFIQFNDCSLLVSWLLQDVAVLMVYFFRMVDVWMPASVSVTGMDKRCNQDRQSAGTSVPHG